MAGQGGIPEAVTDSAETRLALVRALVVAGDTDQAETHLAELAAVDPTDWRIAWYTGLCELARSRPDQAGAAFSAVYDELPGELAPKLALGFAAEAAGHVAVARHYYQTAWAIDRSCVSAAFGAARASLAGGDRVAAITAVAAVPPNSSYHAAAQIAAIRLLVATGSQAPAPAAVAGGAPPAAGGAPSAAARSRPATCARPTAAWACSPSTNCAGSSSRWRSCGQRSTGWRRRRAPGRAAKSALTSASSAASRPSGRSASASSAATARWQA